MKKAAFIIFMTLLVILSLYSLYTTVISFYLTIRYEHFDTRSSGYLFGKSLFTLLFFALILLIFRLAKKKTR